MAAHTLPDGSRAQHSARARGREEEHPARSHRGEAVLAQQPAELRGAEGRAVAEGRGLGAGPEAVAVRHQHQDTPVRPHHPPHLFQHRPALLAELQPVDDEDAVDTAVGQRQDPVVGERDLPPAALGPGHHPLARRHDREHPVRLLTKEPEEGHRVADPQYHLLAHTRPHPADLLAQNPARDPPEPGQVEGIEVDNVLMHRRLW